MKRNILALVLAVVMAFSFTGCSRRDKNSGTVTSSPSPAATTSPSASPETSPSANPSASPETSPETSPLPDDNVGEARTLQDFRDAVKESYGTGYIPSRELTESEIMNMTGITEDMYVDIYAEVGEDETVPDVFIAVEAAEGKAEEVKQKLEVYRSQTGDKYTDEKFTDKIDAARVYQNGNYVFMMLLGDESMMNDNANGDSAMDDMENAAENIGDRLKRGADNAIKAIEDLIGMR